MKNFVSISDIHSDRNLFNQINEFLKEYEVIYILGDATDRGIKEDGTGGVEILLEIKELTEKYPGRVIYIPGNHDEFIIGSFYGNNKREYQNYMHLNGGKQTYKDLCKLEKQGKLSDLCEWLGNLPIQGSCVVDGQRYVFAHALFNEYLYQIEPDYCLFDHIYCCGIEKDPGIRHKAHNVLWYKKNVYGQCKAEELPLADSIMIVGHTPARDLSSSINLKDKNGNEIIVHCVDSGTMHNDPLLKYVSGQKNVEKIVTKAANVVVQSVELNLPDGRNYFVDNSGNFIKKEDILSVFSNKLILQSIIIDDITENVANWRKPSLLDNFKKLKNQKREPWLYSVEKPLSDYMIKKFKTLSLDIDGEEIDCFIGQIYSRDYPFDYFAGFCDYVKTVLLNYLIFNLIKKNNLECAAENIDRFLFGIGSDVCVEEINDYIPAENLKGSYTGFSRDGNGRDIAWALSSEGMKRVLSIHGCTTAREYIRMKLENRRIYLQSEFEPKKRERK